mmetsp:Transcript_20956/g.57996  ORF Transcript_20956/g.57996 Transcript_20956/m.57996 type:complete len:259 (-) Transcript_20956:1191-1967(-)|eukprot:CAMPEP_0168785922 /NCGR_PEP_ID=MMETSP0725-20121227/11005_1 /TAXON_ID=265536 /ORGANISM="Amphiprora sp., Strain CCMP467" /LENGTH=258 /DNA_ID=CAMNT_0008836053 /DNA_START=168 /DNA_END=944 /DNA_ORIENTATION=-
MKLNLLLCLATVGNVVAFVVHQPSTTTTTLNLRIGNEPDIDGTVRIQGGTMNTWKVDPKSKKVHVMLKTNGRPTTSEINLWHGPDYTPMLIKAYLMDGKQYPLNLIIKPKGLGIDTVQVLNTAEMELPINTAVDQGEGHPYYLSPDELIATTEPTLIQGNKMVNSIALDPELERVQVGIHATETKNVKFYLELLKGPNEVKQSIEFYASNGYKTPFYAVFDTPGGSQYTVRIINKYPVEFPMHAYVQPYTGANPNATP